jgi:hypothetical protein
MEERVFRKIMNHFKFSESYEIDQKNWEKDDVTQQCNKSDSRITKWSHISFQMELYILIWNTIWIISILDLIDELGSKFDVFILK